MSGGFDHSTFISSGNMRVVGVISSSFLPSTTTSTSLSRCTNVPNGHIKSNSTNTTGFPLREKKPQKYKDELQLEFKIDKEFKLLRHLGTGAYGVVAYF